MTPLISSFLLSDGFAVFIRKINTNIQINGIIIVRAILLPWFVSLHSKQPPSFFAHPSKHTSHNGPLCPSLHKSSELLVILPPIHAYSDRHSSVSVVLESYLQYPVLIIIVSLVLPLGQIKLDGQFKHLPLSK